MTIAPLPSLPADLAVTGAAGAATDASAEGTADSFAALVLAVLDAGSTSTEVPVDATGVPVADQAGQVHSGQGVVSGPAAGPAVPLSADAAVTTDETDTVPADRTAPADGTEPTDVLTTDLDLVVPVVPMPVTLPAALAAALGLTPIAPVAPAPGGTSAPTAVDAPAAVATPTTPADTLAPAAPSAPVAPTAPEAGAEPAALVTPSTGGPTTDAAQAASSTPVVVADLAMPAPEAGAPEQVVASAAPEVPVEQAAPQTTAAPQAPAAAVTATPTVSAPAAVAQVREAVRSTGDRLEPSEGAERTEAGAPGFVQATAAPTKVADQPATPVTRAAAAQVIPELTRLVQAGPGTHRMVLRLDPEHLGEVRITLTVHPGGVRVRMATGTEDAMVALTDGIQALQRALESVSGRPAGETQLAVLHQARPQDATTTTTAYDQNASMQGDAQSSPHQTPGDRPQADDRAAGRPAGTQVDITARDGSQDGGASGTPRPADPLSSVRSTRLDVSM